MHRKVFKSSAGDSRIKVDTIVERINLHRCPGRSRKSTLGSLTLRPQSPHCSRGSLEVTLVLPLELLREMLDKYVIEIFATEVSVPRGCLNFENSIAQIEDQHILLFLRIPRFFVQPISNGSSSG